MRFTPRPYQDLIREFIHQTPRCCVFADMGMGKTISSLTALGDLALVEDCFPALALGPLRVARRVWSDEAAKWDHSSGMQISPIVGTPAQRKAALRTPADVYTINYENIPWLIDTQLAKGKASPFRTIIADESTKLKGFRLRQSGFRAAMLARIAHHLNTHRWINLTGTPAPNGLLDLWGQMWFVDAGERLGLSYTAFKERWFRPHPNGFSNWVPHDFSQREIQNKIKDVCITVEAKDWFDVQKPIVNDVEVHLPPKAMKLYREMEREMFIQLEDSDFEAFGAAAKTSKCQQIANGAIYHNQDDKKGEWEAIHKVKLEALEDIVEESAGAPVLVAYQFKFDLARLKAHFKRGREIKTQQDEDDWNAGKIPIAFCHPLSMGHGLNLQHGGNILVYYALDWNLESHQQVLERIGPVRQLQSGYNRPVFVKRIVAKGTIDEVLVQRLESKREVQDLLKEAMKRRKSCS